MSARVLVPVLLLVTALSSALGGPLTADQRFECTRRIEETWWRHTSWPAQNPTPKPRLEDVLAPAALARRAEDAELMSRALEVLWSRPLAHDQLQAELDRLARDSRQPSVLREVFEALDDDPVLVAECLARPLLAERLLRTWYAGDARFHGALTERVAGALAAARASAPSRALAAAAAPEYLEQTFERHTLDGAAWSDVRRRAERLFPEGATLTALGDETDAYVARELLARDEDRITIATARWPKRDFGVWWSEQREHLRGTQPTRGTEPTRGTDSPDESVDLALPPITAAGCANEDTWQPTGSTVPDGTTTEYGTAVWTGSELIIWPGARYRPATDTWTPVSNGANAPATRSGHVAVWTGAEMIVWGGSGTPLGSGGRYNPATDSWTRTAIDAATPAPRVNATAVWTGTEMIVWGGGHAPPDAGGRYRPSTDSWTAIARTGAPATRTRHTAVWTGSEMILWGGWDAAGALHADGARYSPASDTWATLPPTTLAARSGHSAVWTGTAMVIWGGAPAGGVTNTGARFNPVTNAWTLTPTANAPSARHQHSAVWTGSEMIVWGGSADTWYGTLLNTGARYNTTTNAWQSTPVSANATPRAAHFAAWTGTEMIVWGGTGSGFAAWLDSGARYNPSAANWVPTGGRGGVPAGRDRHTAVWTGTEMIVWGGYRDFERALSTGGRYRPATDTWAAVTNVGAPEARLAHAAAWTGMRMLVWGGRKISGSATTFPQAGGRYDPVTDTWSPMTTTGAPAGRDDLAAVWTGSRLVVWGGVGAAGHVNTGGRYDPGADAWLATSVTDAPTAREGATAVWSGSRMIAWGGRAGGLSSFGDGGRYDPSTDAWSPTTTSGAPPGRNEHTAIWSGSEMIVWGGVTIGSVTTDTGGRYDPVSDAWTALPTVGAPAARSAHAAAWTGEEMIVWGGGYPYSTAGGRFSAASGTWSPTSSSRGMPDPRPWATAVWSGGADPRLIVWGGDQLGSGGVYCAASCAPRQSWFEDYDGDGFGNPRVARVTCEAVPGGVARGGDCNDETNRINPLSRELCGNRLDDDCDGTTDEGIDELCNDVDDDCDGTVDDGEPKLGEDCSTGETGACSAGVFLCASGTCRHRTGPGPELCNDVDDDCDGAVDQTRDSDGDGVADCDDRCADARDPLQADIDGDGTGDPCDCAPLDPANPRPEPVGDTLRVTRGAGGEAALSWDAVAGAAGYNVYRGDGAHFRDISHAERYDHRCLVGRRRLGAASDAAVPAGGAMFYYLVSATCGSGESIPGAGTYGDAPIFDTCPSPADDRDGDGWPDDTDNCPDFRNPGQADGDGDGSGDVCDGA